MNRQKARPLPDAADAVAAAAAQASAMLKELQAGWLWRLLTIPQPQKRDVSKDQ
jgi:hypothetical protein